MTMRLLMMALAALAPLALASAQDDASTAHAREELLGPAKHPREREVVSPDGLRVAWVERVDKDQCVVVDGKPGPLYEEIVTLSFSGDSRHVRYTARHQSRRIEVVDGRSPDTDEHDGAGCTYPMPDGRAFCVTRTGKGCFVVIDGKSGPALDDVDWPQFDRNGGRLVYSGTKHGKCFWFIEGQPTPEYGGASMRPIFGPGGKRVVYVARKGDKDIVVADGRAGPEFDWASDITISADGAHFAYMGWRRPSSVIVLDNRAVPDCGGVGGFHFSSDGNRNAYLAQKNEKQFVVIDGRPEAEFDQICTFGFDRAGHCFTRQGVFGPDGKRTAYCARKGNKFVVVENGVAGPEYDRIEGPVFSADGARVAYAASDKGRGLMVVNGRPEAQYEWVHRPIFSPDGTHLAYRAFKGHTWFVVLDGKRQPYGAEGLDDDPVFSPALNRFVYIARSAGECSIAVGGVRDPGYERMHGLVFGCDPILSSTLNRLADITWSGGMCSVVVDGVRDPECEHVRDFAFSRDCRHYAYMAAGRRDRPGGVSVVVDGEAGPVYRDLIYIGDRGTFFTFQPDGSVVYFGVRDGNAYRIRHTPPR